MPLITLQGAAYPAWAQALGDPPSRSRDGEDSRGCRRETKTRPHAEARYGYQPAVGETMFDITSAGIAVAGKRSKQHHRQPVR